MMNCIITTALLLFVSAVKSQGISCFKNTTIDTYQELLKGDRFSISLDTYTTANNATYGYRYTPSEKIFAGISLQTTFTAGFQNSKLDKSFTKCSTVTNGLNESNFVMICDKTNIVFLDLHRSNGTLKNARYVAVQASECQNAQSAPLLGTVYVVCTKENTKDLQLYEFTIDTLAKREYTLVQDKPEQALTTNLNLFLDQDTNDVTSRLLIFIYEKPHAQSKEKVSFAVLSLEGANIQNYGYASADTTAQGIADGLLYGFHSYKTEVVVATKDSTGLMRMQRCAKTALFRLKCDSPVELERATQFLKYHDVFVDTSYNKGEHIEIFSVNMTTVTIGVFSRKKLTYGQTSQINITGHSLKQITFVYRVGSSVYLTGPTNEANLNIIDGVVKAKRETGTFEENSYLDNSPGLTLIRRDFFNSEMADLIAFGGKNVDFYRLKKNYILIRTDLITAELANINITLNCSGSNNTKGEITFNLKTMLKVNDERSFMIPSMSAYAGSKEVHIPVNIGQMRGNAPKLELADSSDKRAKLSYELIDKLDFKYASDALTGVLGLEHLGRNVFTAWNENKQVFFKCTLASDRKKYECTKTYKTVDLQAGEKTIATVVNGERLVIVTSSKDRNVGLTFSCQYLRDTKVITSFNIGEFTGNYGAIRFVDNDVQVAVIGKYKDSKKDMVYMAKFTATIGGKATELTLINELGEHFCPLALTWAPRAKNTFYMTSSCSQEGKDSHVYEFSIDDSVGATAMLTKAFNLEGSANFGICVQTQLVNIIDTERNWLYSFDLQGNLDTKLVLPFKEYGYKTLQSYGCDKENDILQVVGCVKPDEQAAEQCSLLTYRANTRNHPFNRVHSIMPLTGEKVNFIASTFNNMNDTMMTLLLSKSLDDMQLFSVEVYGPHIKLDAEAVDKDDTVNIDWKASYPDKIGLPAAIEQTKSSVQFYKQKTDVSIRFINDSKRAPTNGELVNIEDYVATVGPFHSIKKVDEIVINDRLTQSKQFSEMTSTLCDAIFHGNYIFGIDSSKSDTKELKLFKDGKLLETFATLSQDTAKTNLAHVVYNDSAMYFFTFEQRTTNLDMIRAFYTINGGQSWTTAKFEPQYQGFRSIRIIPSGGNKFLFAGYNNRHRYSIQVIPFAVDDTKIVWDQSSAWEMEFQDKVADFDCVKMADNKLVVIAGVEFEREAHFFYLSSVPTLDTQMLILENKAQASLVPKIIETHQDIVFTCRKVENSTESIRCVNSGKNLQSYVVKYDFDLSSTSGPLIKNSNVEAVLKNIVNLRPVRVTFSGDFVVFTVKNLMPLQKDESPQYHKFFKESHLCLVYRLNAALAKETKAGESYTVDVYKILDSSDFGNTDTTDLGNLVPTLFHDSKNVLKLGVNIGCSTKSVRVFNLDGLTMSLKFLQAKEKDFKFQIKGLDGKYKDVMTSQVFKYPDLKREHSKMVILLVSTITLIVAILLVGILVSCRKADEQTLVVTKEDLALDDDNTMKLTIKDDDSMSKSKL